MPVKLIDFHIVAQAPNHIYVVYAEGCIWSVYRDHGDWPSYSIRLIAGEPQ